MDQLVLPSSWKDGLEKQLADGRQLSVKDLGESYFGAEEQIAYTAHCPGFITQAFDVLQVSKAGCFQQPTEVIKVLGYFQTVLKFVQAADLLNDTVPSISKLVRLCFQIIRHQREGQLDETKRADLQNNALEIERQIVLLFLSYTGSCLRENISMDLEIRHRIEEELLDWMMSPSVLLKGGSEDVIAVSKCLRLYRILGGDEVQKTVNKRGLILTGLSTYANSLRLISPNDDQMLHETVLLCPNNTRLSCAALTVAYGLASRGVDTRLVMKEIWNNVFLEKPIALANVPYLTSFSMNVLDLLPIEGPTIKYVKEQINRATSDILETTTKESDLNVINQLRKLWSLSPLTEMEKKTNEPSINQTSLDRILDPIFDENEVKTTHLIQEFIIDMQTDMQCPEDVPKKGYILVCLRVLRYINQIWSSDEAIAKIVSQWKSIRNDFPNVLKSIPFTLTPKQLASLLENLITPTESSQEKKNAVRDDLRSLSTVKDDQIAKSKILQLVNQQLEEEFESHPEDKSSNKYDDVWLARSSAWEPNFQPADNDNEADDNSIHLNQSHDNIKCPDDKEDNETVGKSTQQQQMANHMPAQQNHGKNSHSNNRGRGSNRRGKRWKRGMGKLERVNAPIS